MLKRFRIVGLCLAAVFAMSAVATSSASAAPVWQQCGAGTEFTNSLCTTSGSGPFGWVEVATKVAVTSEGRLTLTSSTGTELECPESTEAVGKDEGFIGPSSADEITKITDSAGKAVVKCKIVKAGSPACSAPATATAVHLPWITKLILVGTEIRDEIVSGTGGAPGYETKCGNGLSLTCTGATSTAVTNNTVTGNVELTFEAKSAATSCGLGITGKVKGTDTILHPAGGAIRVH